MHSQFKEGDLKKKHMLSSHKKWKWRWCSNSRHVFKRSMLSNLSLSRIKWMSMWFWRVFQWVIIHYTVDFVRQTLSFMACASNSCILIDGTHKVKAMVYHHNTVIDFKVWHVGLFYFNKVASKMSKFWHTFVQLRYVI